MSDKKIIEDHPYIRYSKPILSDKEMLARSISFEAMDSRRSTREFSDRPVPREVIETLIKRHLQPLLVHTSNHGLLRR
jgi:hypothetical protein